MSLTRQSIYQPQNYNSTVFLSRHFPFSNLQFSHPSFTSRPSISSILRLRLHHHIHHHILHHSHLSPPACSLDMEISTSRCSQHSKEKFHQLPTIPSHTKTTKRKGSRRRSARRSRHYKSIIYIHTHTKKVKETAGDARACGCGCGYITTNKKMERFRKLNSRSM